MFTQLAHTHTHTHTHARTSPCNDVVYGIILMLAVYEVPHVQMSIGTEPSGLGGEEQLMQTCNS